MTLLFGSIASAFGGDATASKDIVEKNVTPPAKEHNLLCFFDDKICFDVEDRVRFEWRENNFDFNDSADALTDDSWLLQRFRIGVAVKPADWLKIYAQGQDSREFFSDRLDVPGALGAEGNDFFDLRQEIGRASCRERV